MRLKVDFCQCQSHDARSIHEGAWGIPGRLFDSRRMSLGMTKRWRSLYRRWYKKSSGRASIVVGELSVLGKLRFCHIYLCTLYSVLCTLFSASRSNHRCQRLILFTSPHQPAKSLRFPPGQHLHHRNHLNLNHDLNSNHNPLLPTRKSQICLRQTRR
jgi:hypothetical protein